MIFCRAVLSLLGHHVLLIGGTRTEFECKCLLQLLFTRGLLEMKKIKNLYLSKDKVLKQAFKGQILYLA